MYPNPIGRRNRSSKFGGYGTIGVCLTPGGPVDIVLVDFVDRPSGWVQRRRGMVEKGLSQGVSRGRSRHSPYLASAEGPNKLSPFSSL